MLFRVADLCGISLVLLPMWACGGATPAQPTAVSNADFFESAGARLHFVVDLPSGTGPFPGIVIGAGSGRTTTSDGAAYVPFLLQRGFAVLRYDKRGSGQSTGTYRGVSANNSESQIAELAGDMAAALATLAARPGIDAGRLGLMGTSQAGWVMVAAAERTPLARFTIAVTGSVVPIGVNIRYEDLGSLPIDDAYAELAQLHRSPRLRPRARAPVALDTDPMAPWRGGPPGPDPRLRRRPHQPPSERQRHRIRRLPRRGPRPPWRGLLAGHRRVLAQHMVCDRPCLARQVAGAV